MTGETPLEVLLVEDNPGDARYIREILGEATELSARTPDRRGGVLAERTVDRTGGRPAVTHETRLADGLDSLDADRPDVVLLDLNLPDSEGLDTLETVLERTETVPVVVLTGLRDRETGMEALGRGAEEYLVKDEINADLLIRTVYHAIERKAHERELKQYETLIEQSTDLNVIVDPDGTFRYLTPSVEHVLGYDPDELVGETCFDYVHPDDRDRGRDAFEAMLADPERRPTAELRVRHEDGSWIDLHARGRNLLDEPMIGGLVVYTHDVTERKAHERQLERQREQLGALNQLNGVVREITNAVIEQSTRESIERTVCEQLAATESYEFAWMGAIDPGSETVTLRAEAGVEGYLDDMTIPIDPDDSQGRGPTGRACRTQEMAVVNDVRDDSDYEPWRDRAIEYGYRSSAAIPIVHEGTIYGVLNVYADRPDAFAGQEGAVIGQLGELVGHAIAAVERKRALTSATVLEVDLRIGDVFADGRGSTTVDGTEDDDVRITLDQAVPIEGDEFLVYGTTTEAGMAVTNALADAVSHWTAVRVIDEHLGRAKFELRLSEPPLLTAIASHGGYVKRAYIEGGDYYVTAQLPPSVELRQLVEAVREAHPETEVRAQRQVTRTDEGPRRVVSTFEEALTDRQRTVLETAYFAGYFEWPRESAGEDIADSLEIAPATFSEHLRGAEKQIVGALLEDDA